MPAIDLSVVVLPEPEAPKRIVNPLGASNSTSSVKAAVPGAPADSLRWEVRPEPDRLRAFIIRTDRVIRSRPGRSAALHSTAVSLLVEYTRARATADKMSTNMSA